MAEKHTKFTTDLKSVCGHHGDRIVQYGSRGSGQLNSICSRCLDEGTYFAQEVDGFDVLLDDGHFVEIQMPKP